MEQLLAHGTPTKQDVVAVLSNKIFTASPAEILVQSLVKSIRDWLFSCGPSTTKENKLHNNRIDCILYRGLYIYRVYRSHTPSLPVLLPRELLCPLHTNISHASHYHLTFIAHWFLMHYSGKVCLLPHRFQCFVYSCGVVSSGRWGVTGGERVYRKDLSATIPTIHGPLILANLQ